MRVMAVAAALTVASVVRADDEKKPADLEIGQPAPEFTLKNFDGKEVKLAD